MPPITYETHNGTPVSKPVRVPNLPLVAEQPALPTVGSVNTGGRVNGVPLPGNAGSMQSLPNK